MFYPLTTPSLHTAGFWVAGKLGQIELKLRRDAIAGTANHPYDRFYVWNWQTYEKIASV
jgi:hypothetical protein